MTSIILKTLLVSAVLCSSFLGMGCAHHPDATQPPYNAVVVDKTDPNNVTVEFGGACAASVAEGVYDKPGKKEYSISQNGKTYYFSSKKALDRFKKDFPDQAQKASKNWNNRDKRG